ncbi:MAG: hypothetical protein JWO22_3706 [Frankiales bacterium]|nr:hypothetical protein [Frankiales bacterium]
MRRAAGVLAALVLGLLATVRLAPTASADGTVRIASGIEAWYQANPTCELATGCVTTDAVPGGVLPVPAPTGVPLYPSGTLHVGFAGGKETARSYLLFPLDAVVGTVTAVRLTVPLDTEPADGSVTPESSQVQVCLATAPVGRAEAALTDPPKTSCAEHAKLSYVATPAPHLQADLSSMLPDLLTSDGLALVPEATSPAGAWHVVFRSHLSDAKGAASLEVTTSGGASAPLLQVTAPVPPIAGLQPGPVVNLGPGLSTPPALGPVPQVPAVGVTAAPTPVALTPVAQRGAPFLKYPALAAHPGAWLLPPALLLLLGFLSNALRRDLSSTQS